MNKVLAWQSSRQLLLLLASFAVCSCGPTLSPDDRAKREDVERAFGQAYAFEFEANTYVNAKAVSQSNPSRDEAVRIYRHFWFDGNAEQRHDTNYVYLNVYNNQGVFQFQVAWDPKTKSFLFSKADHY